MAKKPKKKKSPGRKKPRTAKQKAATRKLVALNKGKGKTKSTKKRKSSTKKKSGGMHKRPTKENAKNGFKGFLAGGGAGELAQDAVSLVTDNLLANKAVRAAVSIPAGWWAGNKTVSGAVGGIVNTAVDVAFAVMTNRGVARQGRVGRL